MRAFADLYAALDSTTKTTAKVSLVQGWKNILSSSGVNGTDPANALMEIFPPHAIDENNKTQKFIPKP